VLEQSSDAIDDSEPETEPLGAAAPRGVELVGLLKDFPSSFSGMPGPVSVTAIRAIAPSTSLSMVTRPRSV
jgi:hypothetical protein